MSADASPEQREVWRQMSQPSARHLVVEAGPGSGKTTTLIYGLAQLPRTAGPVLLCTFGREPKQQMEALVAQVPNQFGTTIRIKTFNGLGHALLSEAYPSLRNRELAGDRVYDLVRASFAEQKITRFVREDVAAAVQLVALAKANILDDAQAITKVAREHDLKLGKVTHTQLGVTVASVLIRTLETFETEGIGYDDQLWIPIKRDLVTPFYKTILVDEGQDTSPVQIEMIRRASRGRVIVFCDRNQAIFRFRGADDRAVDRIVAGLDADKTTLSTTFRCAQSIVNEARAFAPAIVARPDAPLGEVATIDLGDLPALAVPGDYVIGRTNAAVMDAFLALLGEGIRAEVALDARIAQLASDLVQDEGAHRVDKVMAGLAKQQQVLSQLQEVTAATESKLEAIKLVLKMARFHKTPGSLISELRRLAQAGAPARNQRDFVWCATTHRAKGLEADRVFVLRWTYQREDDVEAPNLQYVAITRAKNTLVYVDSAEAAVSEDAAAASAPSGSPSGASSGSRSDSPRTKAPLL